MMADNRTVTDSPAGRPGAACSGEGLPDVGAQACARHGLDPSEVELLWEMVRRRSFSGRERQLALWLASRLEKSGWKAEIDSTGNLIAETGSAGKTLLFLGHLDTVRGFPEPRLTVDCLWGRGAVDAKGPLAAFLAGAERLLDGSRVGRVRPSAAPPGPLPRLVMIGAVGEESDGRGAKAILGRYRPDWCVVGEPSGWDGLTIGYKGLQHVAVDVVTSRGHGAGQMVTAAEAAARFWSALDEAVGPGARGAPSFGTLTCSLRSIRSRGNGLDDRARMNLSFRLPPGSRPGEIEDLLLGAARAAGLQATGRHADSAPQAVPQRGPTLLAGSPPSGRAQVAWRPQLPLPAFVGGKNNTLVRGFLSAIRDLGGTPRFKLKSGTSDMNLAGPAWGCPILAYGPGDSALDHTPEERIGIGEYAAAIAVWERVLTWIADGRTAGTQPD